MTAATDVAGMRAGHGAGLLLIFTAALAVPLTGRADDGIATDRPDFVESSDTVGKGRFQIETSVAFDRDKTQGVRSRTRSTPTLLRWGAWDHVELRLETDGAIRSKVTAGGLTDTVSGFADTSLGLKWHVADGSEDGSRPGMAWLIHVDAPSGSSAFKGEGWRPSVRFTAEWDLPRDLSAGVMAGLYQERNSDNHRYVGGILAATLGVPLRENWRAFVEVAGQSLASNRNGGKVVTLDTGLTWQLTPDLQMDTAVFRGLSKAAPDWSWTVGVSVRF
ncbi:transporter [Roseateles terrae]|uniref:Transporter n=1 Tax=Roseateles terrae TaxID=431060 RepID=A0ABR6GNE4_9BURK|nr:transporter [Roseateles terrae]MBB3193637.1 hypothetical protein [Roseateles terrae]